MFENNSLDVFLFFFFAQFTCLFDHSREMNIQMLHAWMQLVWIYCSKQMSTTSLFNLIFLWFWNQNATQLISTECVQLPNRFNWHDKCEFIFGSPLPNDSQSDESVLPEFDTLNAYFGIHIIVREAHRANCTNVSTMNESKRGRCILFCSRKERKKCENMKFKGCQRLLWLRFHRNRLEIWITFVESNRDGMKEQQWQQQPRIRICLF